MIQTLATLAFALLFLGLAAAGVPQKRLGGPAGTLFTAVGFVSLIISAVNAMIWQRDRARRLRKEIEKAGGLRKFVDQQAVKQGIAVPPSPPIGQTRTEWKAKRDAAREARIEKEERAAAERAEAHRERLTHEIPFVGRGVSGGLANATSDAGKLSAAGLPVLATAEQFADFLGVDVPTLHWLCYHREADTTPHYVYFAVPKKRGGERIISAPKKTMKAAQQTVLEGILSKLPTHGAAHGFVTGRSILTNAAPHVGRDVVVNIDVKDFFPSVTYPRVKGLFRSLGYSEQAATLLGLICTDAPRKKVTFRKEPLVPDLEKATAADGAKPAGSGKALWVAIGDRRLPQGACTSPAITNLICRRLDDRLTALAAGLGWTYTRYADDLTFSGSDPDGKAVKRVLNQTKRTLLFEGFAPHPDKIRVQRKRGHQNVTGLVVNQKVGVSRAERRRFRAILHNCRKTGPQAQNRAKVENFGAHLRGYAEFVRMVNPAQGARFASEVAALFPSVPASKPPAR